MWSVAVSGRMAVLVAWLVAVPGQVEVLAAMVSAVAVAVWGRVEALVRGVAASGPVGFLVAWVWSVAMSGRVRVLMATVRAVTARGMRTPTTAALVGA
jgi:hypothetical protein